MKALIISDLHGSDRGVRQVHSWIDDLELNLLVVSGDITHFGPITFAKDFLESLEIRTLAIPGNCDPPAILNLLDDMDVNLHGKKCKFEEETFVGFGGSNPTPFDTLFEVPDQEIYDSLHPLMERDVILVTHAPPHGVLDASAGLHHVGSLSLKMIIEEFAPKLSVFGHIHEARGIMHDKTTYVNPGSARRGHGAVVDIGDSVTTTLLG